MNVIDVRTFEQKILFQGTQANYNDLANKDSTKLYFITDTHKLYKGDIDMSEAVRVVTALPSAGAAANNVVYVVNDGGFQKACYTTNGGTSYVDIALAWIQEIVDNTESASYNGNSTTTVPTTKAVVDYVISKVGTSGAITSLAKNASTAAFIDYSTNGSTAVAGSVEVGGVAKIPTWDASTETLTIPYTGFGTTSAGSVAVNFGKYSLVKEARYNATTEKIDFWLEGSDPETDEPDFSVDVSALVTEIAVVDTDSVDLDMSIDTAGAGNHKLSATVKLATKTGVTNYAQIVNTSTSGVQTAGILVDLSTIETSITNVDTSVANLETALTTWGTIPTPEP